jgi:predicted RNase H-like HicB family nuclease
MEKTTYHIDLIREDGTGYFAKVREFRGCMTQGETASETLLNILDATTAWVKCCIEHDDKIPNLPPEV